MNALKFLSYKSVYFEVALCETLLHRFGQILFSFIILFIKDLPEAL